jgi:hypothetical protein
MTEHVLTLGGRSWTLPEQLPFHACKKVQPRLLRRGLELFGGERPASLLATVAKLDEPTLDDLGDAAYHAVHVVDPHLTHAAFLALPIKAAELVGALPALLEACGLEIVPAKEASGDGPKA